jgi:hypothetical protein
MAAAIALLFLAACDSNAAHQPKSSLPSTRHLPSINSIGSQCPGAVPNLPVPHPAEAWAPVDGCRVLVATNDSVRLVTPSGSLLLPHVSGFGSIASVGWRAGFVWVFGTGAEGDRRVQVVGAKVEKTVDVGTKGDLAAAVPYRKGFLVALVDNRHTDFVYRTAARSNLLRRAHGDLQAMAACGDSMIAAVERAGVAELVVGMPGSWSSTALPRGSDVVGVACHGHDYAAAINSLDTTGAPVSGSVLLSSSKHHWRKTAPPGTTYIGSVVATAAGMFVAASTKSQPDGIYVFDHASWSSLHSFSTNETAPSLATQNGTVWALSDSAERLSPSPGQ